MTVEQKAVLVLEKALETIDDLRSYTRSWDWKYGEIWDTDIEEIRDWYDENKWRIKNIKGKP